MGLDELQLGGEAYSAVGVSKSWISALKNYSAPENTVDSNIEPTMYGLASKAANFPQSPLIGHFSPVSSAYIPSKLLYTMISVATD